MFNIILLLEVFVVVEKLFFFLNECVGLSKGKVLIRGVLGLMIFLGMVIIGWVCVFIILGICAGVDGIGLVV